MAHRKDDIIRNPYLTPIHEFLCSELHPDDSAALPVRTPHPEHSSHFPRFVLRRTSVTWGPGSEAHGQDSYDNQSEVG